MLQQLETEISEKERAIEGSERLIGSYELQLKQALEAKHFFEIVKDLHRIKTPYKITNFSGKGQADLFIGDRVYTNNGKGEFKGKFLAIVISLT